MDESRGLVADSSEEEDHLFCQRCGRRWEPGAKFCQKCGAQRRLPVSWCPSCLCCCCGFCVLFLVALAVSITWGLSSLQTWLSSAALDVLSATLQVPVTLGSLRVGLLEGRAAVRDLNIGSPEGLGFTQDFLKLQHLVFDLAPLSLLQSRLLGSASFATEVEELSIKTLHVFIEQMSPDASSNAKVIVEHLNGLATSAAAAPTAHQAEDAAAEAVHALTSRIRVDKVDLSDVGIAYCAHPSCDRGGPATYVIKEILIKDVGKKGKGVFIYQLAEVVVRTLLLAVLKAAPANLRENLLRAVGQGIESQLQDLDFGSVHLDLGDGKGLQSAGELAGWVAGEFASLPLKASNAALALNTKALEAENALRNGAISTQAKMGLEAAKMGTELTGMGVKANTAFTNMGVKANTAFANMGVKANTELLNAETKANSFFNGLRDDFTRGFTGVR